MAPHSTVAFGVLLRQHRLAAGLTQEALAERAGLSVYGIQKLEAGTTHPYRDTAQRLVLALELPSDEAEQLQAAVEPVRRHGSSRRESTASEVRHNIPASLTSFVGREQELIDIPPRLRAARLLTLTGAGGAGKTRLARELARGLIDEYRDGVWLVELAQVADPALVPYRLAAVLGVHEKSDLPMPRALVESLRNSEALLVLDNCEHLLDACATLADMLLRECPTLHVLATSREPLGIPGEVNRSVTSLAVPAAHIAGSVAEVERSPAVHLFVDRASALQPDFSLAADNAHAIALICRRLDGIPLALELGAACLDALTPEQLASRLDQRFRLLTGGNRAAMPRQQTLQAAVDWSYQLLTDTQQRVFDRLSVFASGWTLEAAEAVCAGDGVATGSVLDAVRQLVRKSLVLRIDVRRGSARYGLLETLREYALEKLQSRDDELATIRQRHAAYYSEVVQRLDPAGPTTLLPFSGDKEALSAPVYEVLDGIHDNLRSALRWWLDAQRTTEALALVRALCHLWLARGVPVDARRWVEAVIELAATANDDRDCLPELPSGETNSKALHAQVLTFAAFIAVSQGDTEAARRFSYASAALWRTLGDEVGLAQALALLGISLTHAAEFDEADAVLSEGVAHARASGSAFSVAEALNVFGNVAITRMQYDRAVAPLRESLLLARTVDRASDRAWALVGALVFLGRVVSEQGDASEAMVLFMEALGIIRESAIAGVRLNLCLDWTAVVLSRSGEPLRAATLFGAAEAAWRTTGVTRHPLHGLAQDRDVRAVQAQLDEQAFAEAWALGQAMTVPEAIAYALGEA